MNEAGRRPRLRGEARRVAERTRAVLADADGPTAGDARGGWVDTPEPAGTAEPPRSAEAAGMAEPVGTAGSRNRAEPAVAARHRGRPGGRVFDGLRERVRWDPGRRAAAAVALVALLAVLVTVWQVARSRPQPVSIETGAGGLGSAVAAISAGPDGLHSASSSVAVASPGPSPPGVVLVDVAGKVRHPGVYRLGVGARVIDAVRAAGGALRSRDTATLNLAAPLTDGEQIVVGAAAATIAGAPVGGSSVSGSGTAGAPVDLNTATLEQLEALPGVGPVLGQNILDWRAAHGRFSSVDQLRDVNGIGDTRFAQLQPLVRLS